jgi:hypothetical protein
MTCRGCPKRSHEKALECSHRLPTAIRKVKWTDPEDKMLVAYVEKHGTGNWSVVATGMAGRTGKQCRERWTNRLDPNLNREIWTPQEDAILLFQQKARGNCWSTIAEFLPRRSANSLKNRWCWLARHNAIEQGGSEERSTSPRIPISAEKEAERDDMAQITIPEWSDALDLSDSSEWLSGNFLESAMDGSQPRNQRDGTLNKSDLCEFQRGKLSWA